VRVPWPYAFAMPLVWFAHIALSYLVVGLHCHQGMLDGDVAGVTAVRLVQLALTLAAAAALAGAALHVRSRLAGSDAEEHRHFVLGTTLLAAAFSVYLVWTLGPTLAVEPCHR
jgi:hypothetical protein